MEPVYALLAQKRPNQARGILSSLASERRNAAPDQLAIPIYRTIIEGLMKSIISAAQYDAKPAPTPSGYSTSGQSNGPMVDSTALNLIKLCHSSGCQSHIPLILDRVLPPNSDLQAQIENGLVPLLPHLKLYLTSLGQTIMQEPYASFMAKAIKGYIDVVLGPKPEDRVSNAQFDAIGCDIDQCGYCPNLRKYLRGDDRVLSVTRRAFIREHLEKELEKTRSWGVTWTTIHSGSPYTLQITKPDVLIAPSVTEWTNKRAAGQNFVRDVGDDAVLSRILGAEFVSVAGALGLRTVPSPSSVPSAGLSRQPPTLPVTKKRPSTSGNQETKRPKLDDDVIDLSDLP